MDWTFKCSQALRIHFSNPVLDFGWTSYGLIEKIWLNLVFSPPFRSGKEQIISSCLKESVWWVKSACLAWFLWSPGIPSLILLYLLKSLITVAAYLLSIEVLPFSVPLGSKGWRNQVGRTHLCFCFSQSVPKSMGSRCCAQVLFQISTHMACSVTLKGFVGSIEKGGPDSLGPLPVSKGLSFQTWETLP